MACGREGSTGEKRCKDFLASLGISTRTAPHQIITLLGWRNW
ncbi:hypothetical protein [Rubritalea tangerina]